MSKKIDGVKYTFFSEAACMPNCPEVEALAKKSENTIETSKIPLQGEQAQKE